MKHLIIGNGVAGTTAAIEIRKTDPSASIRIVTEEPYPYYRHKVMKTIENRVDIKPIKEEIGAWDFSSL